MKEIFAEVDRSNKRFDAYSKEQRKALRLEMTNVRERVSKMSPKEREKLLKKARASIKNSLKK